MIIYVIDKGDTIYGIAKRFNVSTQQLVDDNQITDPEHLVVGSSIVIADGRDIFKKNDKIGEMVVNGYCYPYVNPEILSTSLPWLTYLSIFSYQVYPDGEVEPIDDEPVVDMAIAGYVSPKMVITNIKAGANFDSELAHQILVDEEVQDRLLDNCIDIMMRKGYVGLDVDFEYLFPEDKKNYNMFLKKAKKRLKDLGYPLSTAVAPKVSADQQGLLYEAHDYRAHGKYVDEVILMTYEWGYLYGPPMAVAPLDQVRRVIEYAVTEIPSEKILMGIPNYGYDWTLPYIQGEPARTISNPEAINLAIEYGAEIQFDETALSPYFTYYDHDKKEHIVWFEDARSVYSKLKLVEEYNLGGVSYWTVNNRFNQNWAVLKGLFDVEKYK